MAKAGRKSGLALWVLITSVAIFELAAHPLIRAEAPDDEAWEKAAAFVRERFEPTDRIAAAPAWADPIVRGYLGDLLSARTASASDLAGAGRVWELAIRGASTRAESPSIERDFEGVRVRMWPLSTDEIIYDFVEEVREAEVALLSSSGPRPCPWERAKTHGGGLGRGPIAPVERFVCDPRRPWLWVGATVMADLDLEPRRCIWQHPTGSDPVSVTFHDVPFGERLAVHGGIDYNNERKREHSPVTLRVFIGARVAGELIHEDGDGWARLEIDTSELDGAKADVRFETTTDNPYARTFCWSGSTRRPGAARE